MNAKRWIALGIAAGLFFVSVIVNFATSALKGDFTSAWEEVLSMDSTLNEEVLDAGSSGDRIAVLEVNGVIQDTGGAGSLFESAGYNHRQTVPRKETGSSGKGGMKIFGKILRSSPKMKSIT